MAPDLMERQPVNEVLQNPSLELGEGLVWVGLMGQDSKRSLEFYVRLAHVLLMTFDRGTGNPRHRRPSEFVPQTLEDGRRGEQRCKVGSPGHQFHFVVYLSQYGGWVGTFVYGLQVIATATSTASSATESQIPMKQEKNCLPKTKKRPKRKTDTKKEKTNEQPTSRDSSKKHEHEALIIALSSTGNTEILTPSTSSGIDSPTEITTCDSKSSNPWNLPKPNKTDQSKHIAYQHPLHRHQCAT
ncbi:unnamed protein product [Schistocephalus solidus]|uniref:VOC domain-containing protein n=1 Tax=Schistocephalus solidus TaxID=70667 RepID=A0A183SSC9_SCHSO|nr:unnamed protein product [Schistocephalus solidus]